MPDSNGWSVSSALNWPPACSEWARSQHLDPVGSAGHYQGFLLVEQPLPWPFDVSTLPALVEVARLAAAAGLRLQTVMPVAQQDATKALGRDVDDRADQAGPPARTESLRRLICYRSARPGWAGPLVRSERATAPGLLAEATADMLSQDPGREDPRAPGNQVIDVLVCTHGRRDACCGARGMELVNEVLRDPLLARAMGSGCGGRATPAGTGSPRQPFCCLQARCGHGRTCRCSGPPPSPRAASTTGWAVTGAAQHWARRPNRQLSGPCCQKWDGRSWVRCGRRQT